jgi:hypothetical protein
VQPDEVLKIIVALEEWNLQVWIDGGWGVDALLGNWGHAESHARSPKEPNCPTVPTIWDIEPKTCPVSPGTWRMAYGACVLA